MDFDMKGYFKYSKKKSKSPWQNPSASSVEFLIGL